ncbi:FecR domain-containing protein, partial [Bacteroidota bacterium]
NNKPLKISIMKNQIDEYKIAELIFLELNGEITDADKEALYKWINESSDNQELYNKIINENNIKNKIDFYNKLDKQKAWNNLSQQLDEKEKIKNINFPKILKYAAVLIPLLIGGYILVNYNNSFIEEEITIAETIPPGTQKATLTTSTNEKIELGKTEKKRIFNFKKATVTDTSHTLTYQNIDKETKKEVEIAYNTLETPRGGEYTLILSDGTRVFLNAETKLVFPEIFIENTREVTLEGEAYFEVAKLDSKPFIVKTKKYDVKVYGTVFNVSAYENDINIHTTLVEGSVGINLNNEEIRLIPGEQINYNKEDDEISKKKVDTYVYTAWKEGKFVFEQESLENILNRLSRWYNTEVHFETEKLKNYHFSGTLNRYDNIDEILDMIALTTNIEFKISDNMILVKKKK